MHTSVHDYVYVINRYANGLLLIMFRYHSRIQYHIQVPFIRLLEMVLICPSFCSKKPLDMFLLIKNSSVKQIFENVLAVNVDLQYLNHKQAVKD